MTNSFQLLGWLYARFKISPFDEFGNWIVLESFDYHIWFKESWKTINIPKGFVFNGASIPRFFWFFFTPMDSDSIIASCIHDYLYSEKIFTRQRSDEIYYEIMWICRTPKWKKVAQYLALRGFGWVGWK